MKLQQIWPKVGEKAKNMSKDVSTTLLSNFIIVAQFIIKFKWSIRLTNMTNESHLESWILKHEIKLEYF